MITNKNKLVKIFKAKTKCFKKSKEKKLMQIEKQNLKICKMLLGGNDTYENKVVKIFKVRTNC